MFGNSENNFVQKVMKFGKMNDEISIIDDQIGSPTYACDVAEAIIKISLTEKYGVYHATNEGFCSWAEFAEEIFSLTGLRCKVIPIKSCEYVSKAKRPQNSRLSKKSLTENGFALLPSWQDALSRYLNKINVRCDN
jgi:dTDP-4-dehydrorhamnose reductase